MNKINQRGFHLLHILPLIVIVALVAFVGVRVLNQSKAAVLPYSISCFISDPSIVKQSDTSVTVTVAISNPAGSRAIDATSGTVREQVGYKTYVGTTLLGQKAVATTSPAVGKGTYLASNSSQVLNVTVPGPNGKKGTWKATITPKWQKYANGTWTNLVSTSCSKSISIQASTSGYAISCTVTGPTTVKQSDMNVPVSISIKNNGSAITNTAGTLQESIGIQSNVDTTIVGSGSSWMTTPSVGGNTPLASGASQNVTATVPGPGGRIGTWKLTVTPSWQQYISGAWKSLVGTSCSTSKTIQSSF